MKRLLAISMLLLIAALLTGCGTGSGKIQSTSVSTPKPTSSNATALQLTTSTLANGTVGSSYSAALTATGGTAPYTWSLASGTLPAGLSLSTSGSIGGTPTTSGAFSVQVAVKDAESTPQTATATLTLTINAAPSSSATPPSTSSAAPSSSASPTSTSTGSSSISSGYASYLAANYGSAQGYTSSNTYYVSATGSDSNSGSQSSPWATLAHADSAAPSCSLVWFEPGTYTLSGTGGEGITTSGSGTSSCHKVYASTTYGGALLRPSGSGNGYAAWVENGSYTDHLGFDINNPNGCEGFYGGGPTGGVYVYNIVHDVGNGSSPASGTWCSNGVGGGGIEPGTNHGTIADNVIYNIGYSGNEWAHGIYMGGGYMHVFNNIVYNASGGCIQDFNNSESDVIVNNTLTSCGTFGIVLGGDTCTSSTSGNDFVSNNIFDANASHGNLSVSCGGTPPPSTYTNNINYGGGAFDVSASNTITSNPDFDNLASPASGGNFELQAGSPAIGAGMSTNAPAVDINGTPRGANSPSIGAYE